MSLQPWVEPEELDISFLPGDGRPVVWKNGEFTFNSAGGENVSITVSETKAVNLDEGWTLAFPKGWDAPELVEIGKPTAWSELLEKPAKHFSGTATYSLTMQLENPEPDQRLLLDLGRVGDIAAIKINGEPALTLWAAPYRADITEYVKAGSNILEIAVTNTWHNRLTFDVAQPEKNRKTWTYAHPPADSPLEFSGIGGPVRLHVGKVPDIGK